MSESPAALSNGQTPTPKAGAPAGFVRRRKAADPLRPRKPVRKSMAQKPVPAPGANSNGAPNGTQLGPDMRYTQQKVTNGFTAPTQSGYHMPKLDELKAPPRQTNFSNAPRGRYQDYPLFTTKRALTEGLRYHIAKFMSKKPVDPYDQNEFPRPVTLHRRDPRAPPPGKPVQDVEPGSEDVPDSKEREKQEILKAEKERQRAEDLAQIAPSGTNASAMAKKKHKSFRNEKTTQVHRLDKNEADKKESDLRYEEALPWFLEDVDGNSTWQGAYEAPLSGLNAMLVTDGPVFRMVPIEKWYRFNQQPKFKTFTGDEVEAHMKKKFKEARWVMKTDEQKQLEKDTADYKRMRGVSSYVKQESDTFKAAGRNEKDDIDDVDYDDLFDNDDEQQGLEPDRDEVAVEAQARIKKEQYSSNVFGEGLFRDERELDKEQKELQKEADMRKRFGKSTKKALRKRERNLAYQSDSEDHPYSSVSEDDTSDEEKQAEIDRRKDEEAKAKLKVEAAKNESKLPSGASSKGTNTPSGRPKHTDPLKKVNKLKRPGSPNLSESSGNESSRKKIKKSSQKTGTSTPADRASPAPTSQSGMQRTTSMVKLNVNPSRLSEVNPNSPTAGSDGEATGGEMSDGGRKRKLKLRLGGSPTGSRAGSPAPGRAGSNVGSRAGSPQLKETVRTPSTATGPITAAEIRAALPATGISVTDMLKGFKSRLGEVSEGKMNKSEFIQLVKQNSRLADKLLYPK